MNLDKAIALMEKSTNTCIPLDEFQHLDAIRLLIEAGKQIKREREKGVGFWADRLPGETKE